MEWMIDGLPLHPLMVHAAVVLLAANGMALLGSILVPPLRRWLGWGLPLLGVVTAVTTWVTKMAGENLLGNAEPVGALADHTHWGGWAGVVAIVLGVTTVVYWFVVSPRLGGRVSWLSATPTRVVVSVLAAGVAVAALAVDFLAGHSGATSVWG
ncbi:MAG TPA: hypothetical protein VJ976_11805 [Ornithinimicrobium sp.]|uniref:hypothetical protein n=1 Tax=Ornithinimicrobium sp. TaxID=1977084 RepID=UPI002B4A7BCA|nr:hypothetical protein [Ornithinimicrobium sp.]HKJ13058.1 hypothetical protein [Ornithinimicrobium sp.]